MPEPMSLGHDREENTPLLNKDGLRPSEELELNDILRPADKEMDDLPKQTSTVNEDSALDM